MHGLDRGARRIPPRAVGQLTVHRRHRSDLADADAEAEREALREPELDHEEGEERVGKLAVDALLLVPYRGRERLDRQRTVAFDLRDGLVECTLCGAPVPELSGTHDVGDHGDDHGITVTRISEVYASYGYR